MAKHTVITRVDDLNESEDNVDTVEFMLDSIEYEIDLDETNRAEFHEKLAKYVSAARIIPKAKKGRKKGHSARVKGQTVSTNKKYDREHSMRIRERARFAGEQVAERGRIPDAIADRFNDDAVAPPVKEKPKVFTPKATVKGKAKSPEFKGA